MAMEAITQVWELDGHEVQVSQGIKLRNVTLVTALAIPEDENGIETLLTLCPVRFDNPGGNKRYSYRFQVVSVIHSVMKMCSWNMHMVR